MSVWGTEMRGAPDWAGATAPAVGQAGAARGSHGQEGKE